MSRWAKLGIVCAGYALAIAAGTAAAYLYNLRVSALPYDTSGGMYAAGESMAALGVFLVVALAPTLLALWFLRGNRRLWQAVAFASLGFAVAGLLAVLMPLVVREPIRSPGLALFGLFGLAQLLGAPFWTGAFALFALFAPTAAARRLLVAAVGLQIVICGCAAIHWLLPRPPF